MWHSHKVKKLVSISQEWNWLCVFYPNDILTIYIFHESSVKKYIFRNKLHDLKLKWCIKRAMLTCPSSWFCWTDKSCKKIWPSLQYKPLPLPNVAVWLYYVNVGCLHFIPIENDKCLRMPPRRNPQPWREVLIHFKRLKGVIIS